MTINYKLLRCALWGHEYGVLATQSCMRCGYQLPTATVVTREAAALLNRSLGRLLEDNLEFAGPLINPCERLVVRSGVPGRTLAQLKRDAAALERRLKKRPKKRKSKR